MRSQPAIYAFALFLGVASVVTQGNPPVNRIEVSPPKAIEELPKPLPKTVEPPLTVEPLPETKICPETGEACECGCSEGGFCTCGFARWNADTEATLRAEKADCVIFVGVKARRIDSFSCLTSERFEGLTGLVVLGVHTGSGFIRFDFPATVSDEALRAKAREAKGLYATPTAAPTGVYRPIVAPYPSNRFGGVYGAPRAAGNC